MLKPVASLCQCNWRNSLSSTLNKRTGSGWQSTGARFFFFEKKGILSLACPVRLLETCRGNLFYDIPSSLASQSQIAPAPSFRWIFTIFRIRSRRSALVNTGPPTRPNPRGQRSWVIYNLHEDGVNDHFVFVAARWVSEDTVRNFDSWFVLPTSILNCISSCRKAMNAGKQ